MPSIQTSNVGTNSINGDSTIDKQLTCCCLPNGACLKIDSLIALNGASECVRVLCSNENCSAGQYMHRECFESWEQNVLTSLKSVGRARLWSDRQRLQNLWTKKGYELVYKVCGCKCGRGHIRKDLEWSDSFAFESAQQSKNSHFANSGSSMGGQRTRNSGVGDDSEAHNRKKKRSRNNQKPAVSLTLMNPSGYHPNSQQQNMHQQLHMYHQQIHQNGHNTVEFTQDDSAVSNNNNANGVGGNTQLSTGDDNSSNNNSNIVDLSPNKNVGVIGSGLHGQNQLQIQQQNPNFNNSVANKSISTGQIVNALGLDICVRSSSLSCSDSGSNSPTASHSSDASVSPIQHRQKEQILQLHQQYHTFGKNILSGINSCPTGGPNLDQQMMASVKLEQQQQQNDAIFSKTKNMSCAEQQQLVQQQKNKEVEIYSERVRSTSGCNGIFSRRLDFSSFNLLPKTRLNSYQVKIEDEGNHGNDETRLFILSSLAQSQMSRVVCILCEDPMLVFDRYPLVDGSFFLSPKQHSASCIEVKYDGRALFLTCVCMACLDGTAVNRVVNCRFCGETWDGSNLVLGTMYSYDIFAAMPCCAERLKCNNCFKLLLHPQQRLNFYSDYSHCVTCPYCATQDTHFVKPLNYCFTKSAMVRHKLIA